MEIKRIIADQVSYDDRLLDLLSLEQVSRSWRQAIYGDTLGWKARADRWGYNPKYRRTAAKEGLTKQTWRSTALDVYRRRCQACHTTGNYDGVHFPFELRKDAEPIGMTVCPRHVSTRNASWSKYHLVHAAWPYKHMANLRHVNDFKRYPTGRRMYYDSDARFNRMYAKTQVEALQAAFETRQRSRILAIMPDAQRVFDITDRLRQSPAIDGDLQQRYRDILSSDTVSRLEAESLLATATIRPRQQTVLQSADATVITRQLTQEAWTATSRSPAAERFKELYACCLHALDKQARYEALQRYHTVRYGDEGRRSFNAVWDRDHATYQGHKLDSRDITYRTDLLSEQHSMLRDYCVEQQGGTVEMLANETPERQSWSDLRPSEIALIYKHYYVLK